MHVDESGFAPSAARRFGYAPKGQRIWGLISGKTRPRTSLLAARINQSFTAPCLVEGTCNAELFNTWLKHELCPLLDDNHVVVMDNAKFHKSPKTKDLIQAQGATSLYLPPYSPDLNPIEHDFAALKRLREYDQNQSLEEIVASYK